MLGTLWQWILHIVAHRLSSTEVAVVTSSLRCLIFSNSPEDTTSMYATGKTEILSEFVPKFVGQAYAICVAASDTKALGIIIHRLAATEAFVKAGTFYSLDEVAIPTPPAAPVDWYVH